MTHNLPNSTGNIILEPAPPIVFRPAVTALQKVWKVLKQNDFDVMKLSRDEITAYYELIDFCDAILESEIPSDIDLEI